MSNYYHLKVRRDTAANWASNNPTPADGEICLESDTGKFKFGDGVTAYSVMSYFTISAATTSAAGLMSAADKTKLNGITISLYATLASPTFTGTPYAPTAASRGVTKQIATLAYVEQAIALTSPYMIRCEFTVSSAGAYTVLTDDTYCTYMAVNGSPVDVGTSQKLVAGTNYVDYLFYYTNDALLAWNTIPDNAFNSLTYLTRCYLPANIFRIGDGAFADSGLSEVWAMSPTPPTLGSSPFDNTSFAGGGTVYIHKDHDTLYQSEWAGVGCAFNSIS